MKKLIAIIITSFVVAVIGGVGTFYLFNQTTDGMSSYMREYNDKIIKSSDIFSSDRVVDTIEIKNSLMYDINIKKSNSKDVKINASIINGVNPFNINLDNGVLRIDIKKGMSMNQIVKDDEFDTYRRKVKLLYSKQDIERILKNRSIYNSEAGIFSTSKNKKIKVVIEVPNSVNLRLENSPYTKKVTIADGMIKDKIDLKLNNYYDTTLIYNNMIKNLNVDIVNNEDFNNTDIVNIYRGLKIKNLNVYIPRGNKILISENDPDSKVENVKLVVKNGQGKIVKSYDDRDNERNVISYIYDVINNDGVYVDDGFKNKVDRLNKGINKVDMIKYLSENFKDECNLVQQYSNDFYDAKEKQLSNLKSTSVYINPKYNGRVDIDAKDYVINLNIGKNSNPMINFKTREGIDARYYLLDKVSINTYKKGKDIKDFKGSIDGYIKKYNSNYNENLKTQKADISINAKKIFLTDNNEEQE